MGKTRPQRGMGYGFGAADLVEADQVDRKVLRSKIDPRCGSAKTELSVIAMT